MSVYWHWWSFFVVRCSCIQQADAANGYQHTRRKHTKSSGQSNGGATSPKNGHIAAVAGAGLALSAYLVIAGTFSIDFAIIMCFRYVLGIT